MKNLSMFSLIDRDYGEEDIICELRPYQINVEDMLDEHKYLLVCWSRRLGKDIFGLYKSCKEALENPNSLIYYILPTAKQAKLVIAEGKTEEGDHIVTSIVKENCLEISRSGKIVHHDNTIRFKNGSTIVLHGSDSDNLVGTNVNMVVVSEGALCQLNNVIQYLIPSVMKVGGKVLIISTPRLGSQFNELVLDQDNNYQKSIIPADSYRAIDNEGNRIYTDELLAEAKGLMSEEKFNQEYLCDMNQHNELSIYGNSLSKALYINDFKLNKEYVYVSFDLGTRDKTSMWFAVSRKGKLNIFHHYSNSNVPTKHFIQYLSKFCLDNNIHLSRLRLIFPHDGAKRMDTGEALITRVYHYKQAGFHTTILKPSPVLKTIEVTRASIQNNDIAFVNCATVNEGIQNVKRYEWKSGSNGENLGVPNHGVQGFSDIADSLEYMCVAFFYDKYVKESKKNNQGGVFSYV